MEKVEKIFRFVVILFGFLGLLNIISTNIAIPMMFLFGGFVLLANAKLSYDKGKVEIAKVYLGSAVLIYAIMAYIFVVVLFNNDSVMNVYSSRIVYPFRSKLSISQL